MAYKVSMLRHLGEGRWSVEQGDAEEDCLLSDLIPLDEAKEIVVVSRDTWCAAFHNDIREIV